MGNLISDYTGDLSVEETIYLFRTESGSPVPMVIYFFLPNSFGENAFEVELSIEKLELKYHGQDWFSIVDIEAGVVVTEDESEETVDFVVSTGKLVRERYVYLDELIQEISDIVYEDIIQQARPYWPGIMVNPDEIQEEVEELFAEGL